MGLSAGIKLDGFRETQAALKRLAPELDKAMKAELKDVAELVGETARALAGPSSRTGRARGSIRAGADGKGPYLAGGKKAVPYYAWLEFGSRTPVRGHPRSYGPWFRSGAGPKGGRFIYPAIRKNEDTILEGGHAAVAKAREAAEL